MALAMMIALVAMGQDTKKVVRYSADSVYTEEYYVLKSDETIKHGSYLKIGWSNLPVESGEYKNNLKEGVWTTYFSGSEEIHSLGEFSKGKKSGYWIYNRLKNGILFPKGKGNYKNGDKSGVWEFYSKTGKLIQKYNFDTRELEYPIDRPKQPAEGEALSLQYSTTFIGGNEEIFEQLWENLVYPKKAEEAGIQGKVIVGFVVDANGEVTDIHVIHGIGGGCDESAMDAVRSTSGKWIPARKQNGETIATEMSLPIDFSLR